VCGRLGRARCVLWVSLETRERANTEVPALRATQVMRSWAQRATCAGLASADPVSPPALPLSHLGERGVLPGPRVGRHTPTDAIDPIHYTIATATPWLRAKVRSVERSARRSALKSRLHLLRSARTLLRTSCAEEEEGSAASGGMWREDVGGCEWRFRLESGGEARAAEVRRVKGRW